MVVDEVPLTAEPRDAQEAGHGPLTRCQESADEQNLSVSPGAVDDRGANAMMIPAKRAGRCGMAVSCWTLPT